MLPPHHIFAGPSAHRPSRRPIREAAVKAVELRGFRKTQALIPLTSAALVVMIVRARA